MNRSTLVLATALLSFCAAMAQNAPLAGVRTSSTKADPACAPSEGCEEHAGSFSAGAQPNGVGTRTLVFHDLKTFGPSANFGNFGGWTVTHVIAAPHIVFGTSGIDQYEEASLVKNGVGDLAGLYFYAYGGGRAAASDEGVTGITVESGEIAGYFQGTISGGGGRGATALSLTPSKAPKNWNATCNGCMLLDISKGSLSGRLNGATQHFGSTFLFQLPTTAVTGKAGEHALPISHAWCTTTSALPFSPTAGTGTTHTIDCTLGSIGGRTPAFTTGLITIAGPMYPEQALISAAGQPSGGHQSLTLANRNPHEAASILFQGGIAGQSLSFDDNLATSGFRTSYYVYGSVDGVNLIYGSQIGGGIPAHTLPRLHFEAETNTSGFHLYPSAEVVANTASPAAPQLEPNSVDWEPGDAVENPRFQSFGGFGVRDFCTAYTPTDQDLSTGCMLLQMGGSGVSGSYHAFRMINHNPVSMYHGGGGVVDAIPALSLEGNYSDTIQVEHGPLPSTFGRNALINVSHTAMGDRTPFNLFSLPGSGPGAASVTYDPGTLIVGFPQGISASTLSTSSNCANAHNPANCGSAASGSIAIPPGSSSVTVVDSAVTANSQILITPDMSLDARLGVTCNKLPGLAFAPYGILKRTPANGFVLGIAAPVGAVANCYSYTIVN